MPDHYRALVQSLMQLGFLFSRMSERKQEVWRNRLTEQEVMFDRHEVAGSPTGVARVLKEARTAKPGESATPAPPVPVTVPDGPVLREVAPRPTPRAATTAQPTAIKARKVGGAKTKAKAKAGPVKAGRAGASGRPGTSGKAGTKSGARKRRR